MSLDQTQAFKEGYDKLSADYKAETDELKSTFATEVEEAKATLANLPPEAAQAVESVQTAAHTCAEGLIAAAEKYVADVKQLYEDSYSDGSTKPIDPDEGEVDNTLPPGEVPAPKKRR